MPTVQAVPPVNYADLLMKSVGTGMQFYQMQQQQERQDRLDRQKQADRGFKQSFGLASSLEGKPKEQQAPLLRQHIGYLKQTGQSDPNMQKLLDLIESGDQAQFDQAQQSIGGVLQGGYARGFPDPRGKSKQQQFSNVMQLRKEIQNRSKPFIEITDSYSRMLESEPTAQGDIALIFNYMKMLDPGSVVRESEYATAANAAGVPSRIKVMWNKMIDGEKLSKEQRAKFISQSKAFYGGQKHRHDTMMDDYIEFGKRRGIPEEDIYIKYGEPRTKKQKQEARRLKEEETLQQELLQQEAGPLPGYLERPTEQPIEQQVPTGQPIQRREGRTRPRDLTQEQAPEGVTPEEWERAIMQLSQGATNGA